MGEPQVCGHYVEELRQKKRHRSEPRKPLVDSDPGIYLAQALIALQKANKRTLLL